VTERLFIFRHQLVRVSGVHQTGLDALDPTAYLYDLTPIAGATVPCVRYAEFEAAPENVSVFPQRAIPPVNAAVTPGAASPPLGGAGHPSTLMER
jgi:hypothetical protein